MRTYVYFIGLKYNNTWMIEIQLLLVTILLCATGGDARRGGKGRGGMQQQSYGGAGQQSYGGGGQQQSYGPSAVRINST